ncbi:MAG: DUF4870 domain-containing protein [Longispora sp.]|nr:DUF4870 domain-containing protein [Longispora sp. (in: high G+C Gram-positive bacteria)]
MPQPPPPGYASPDEKTWALVAHFGGPVGMLISCGVLGFVAPLIAFLAKGNESTTVRRHALAALNFQGPLSVVAVALLIFSNVSAILPDGLEALINLVFLLLRIGVIVVSIVFGIIAGMKASRGEEYNYPFGFALIK